VGRPSGSKRAYDEGMLRDLVNASTPMEFVSAIHDANPTEEAVPASQPDAGELSRQHDFGKCWNDRPGCGVLAVTQKLRANSYKRFSGLYIETLRGSICSIFFIVHFSSEV
jgi:hypothetical protein